MKKIYNSPVITLTQVTFVAFVLGGSAKGSYDDSSVKNEGTENMSRRNRWDYDNEY
jgi:hypothetical protein